MSEPVEFDARLSLRADAPAGALLRLGAILGAGAAIGFFAATGALGLVARALS